MSEKKSENKMFQIGVISDTHGLLRPEVLIEPKKVDYIIHAGDIGSREILQMLHEIAPVLAVRGNTDNPCLYPELESFDILEISDFKIYVLHNLDFLDLDPCCCDFQAVVYGHSHSPHSFYKNGVLYLNPGSAGPGRFNLPVCFAVLKIDNGKTSVRHIEISNQKTRS